MLGGRWRRHAHSGTDGLRHTSRSPVYAETKQRATPSMAAAQAQARLRPRLSTEHGSMAWAASGAPVRRCLLLLLAKK
jgi:hypothetical protein